MSGIYVASRVWHAHLWRACRDRFGSPILSTWIDEAGEGQTPDLSKLWQRIAAEVAECDLLVMYVALNDTPLKGALIEAGMAVAHGKRVHAVIDDLIPLHPTSYRPIGSWLLHPLVTIDRQSPGITVAAWAEKLRGLSRPVATEGGAA